MKRTETLYSVDIETSLNETNSLERYIGSILENENFNSLNYLQVQKSRNNSDRIIDNAEIITINIDALAPYSTLITWK